MKASQRILLARQKWVLRLKKSVQKDHGKDNVGRESYLRLPGPVGAILLS